MDIQFEQLRTFAAVIDEGTFEAAARKLQVTPSAVSQRIKALEQQVGRVLVRRTKPAGATESGQVIMRLARQVAMLEDEASYSLNPDDADSAGSDIPLVVNADSLATWVLPTLASLLERWRITFDIHRENEMHSADVLREGAVMAAISSTSEPVQGCSVRKLGSMRYRAMASEGFIERWFSDGVTPDSLSRAPHIDFDRKDSLQTRFLRGTTRKQLEPPKHFVPASSDFRNAVELGLGWGMLPEQQVEGSTRLRPLGVGRPIDVPLFWQRWKLDSPVLDAVSEAVLAGARRFLR
ncbi:LysR family transcriptional regulator ArgP [Saxibacter everestensis]|uniref:LysR family transcriptional regulator ArgP n=1 Tax=Saxibacter everestensis TaxID=2909229 RepID=A0ABY8QY71_9MICO|nr:LysR family transcriptional regulator ArgP [Brevibacteriaceae bacterium ZFBP1038]